MKVYFHLNLGGFSNCYIVVNEKTSEAIIIDPGKITDEIISRIEDNHLKLSAVLITHNHGSHAGGLHTLRKIYSPKIFAADWEVAGEDTTVISGDGNLRIAKMIVRYKGGEIGSTNSSYSEYILKSNIEKKIFSQQDNVILMPGHGPPTTLGAVKAFTADFKKMIQSPQNDRGRS